MNGPLLTIVVCACAADIFAVIYHFFLVNLPGDDGEGSTLKVNLKES